MGDSQAVLGSHSGSSPAVLSPPGQHWATAKDTLNWHGGWLACTCVSPWTDFKSWLLLQGCSFTPRSCREGMRCACLGWETLYLFCHKYLCPSLYEWRKCQSEADKNIQTKEDTSGGFCEINVAERRKWSFSPLTSFLQWALCTSLQEFSTTGEAIGSQIRLYSPSKGEVQPEVCVICSLKDCTC